MKIGLIFSLLILKLICVSCNYKLFVDKRNIFQIQKGYLVFYTNEISFYPSNDTIDVKFLEKNHIDGYRIEYKEDLYWLDSLASDNHIIVNTLKDGKTIQVTETISLIPVEIQFILGEAWTKNSEKFDILFVFNNEERNLRYKVYDFRRILLITAVRKKDIARLPEFYNPTN